MFVNAKVMLLITLVSNCTDNWLNIN